MERLPLYVLFFAVAIGAYLWTRFQRNERHQALARFASRSGLRYSKNDPYGLVWYDFRLFGKGDDRGCENVLSGRWQNLPVKEADYWYSTKSTDAQGHPTDSGDSLSIVIADLPVTVPYVSVQEETLSTWLADRIGFHDIDFESEDFNRQFQVTAADREFAFKLIDPRMIEWLVSTGGQFAFEIRDRSLLVACEQLEPDRLAILFGAAKGFTDHIPQLVVAEYGTEQQAPSGGRPPGEPPARADGEKSPS